MNKKQQEFYAKVALSIVVFCVSIKFAAVASLFVSLYVTFLIMRS